jgi:methylated-DNA-[protein]-cysteine S-methyltransferase
MGNGDMQYTTFETNWGYVAIAGRDGLLCRMCLPVADRQAAQREIVRALALTHEDMQPDESFLPDLQERIIAYFEGENVDFSTDPAVNLDGLSPFDRKVLLTCRKIPPGETATYGELAVRIGHPGAARAVGSALAHNPIPLIIPCHRVLRTDGTLGGFSAPGGITTKQRLLRHEQAPVIAIPGRREAARVR